MKAITLISGGLDSILAAKVIQSQGIEVIPLHFKIPFCQKIKTQDKRSEFIKETLGTELKLTDISESFLSLINKPRYGFGSNMNPCIDCKILMFSRAKELMSEFGAQFIVTGEVLGQRQMSQHKQALNIIAKRSGLEDLLVRPLCAQLLPETLPEKEGWINRDSLLNFSGRRRTPQFNLAESFKIKEYAQPSGGCLLTDPEFSHKLKELIAHNELSLKNVELLKVGRHFRLAQGVKLVVGRNENENEGLMNLLEEGDFVFMPVEVAGPTSLARGLLTKELIELSQKITCRYCDKSAGEKVRILYFRFPNKKEEIAEILPIGDAQLSGVRV